MLTHSARTATRVAPAQAQLPTSAAGEAWLPSSVLRALGFAPSFRYEKFRAEWGDGKGHVVVDETPIANFGEIEGPPRWIDGTARRLGIQRSDYITLNYAGLFQQWKQRTGSPAREMTFKAVRQKRSRTFLNGP